ncbi:MAG: hypothetical protein KF760_18485 [Candidatus Eremiobacteraeota bacterium]|nr:hypothetical protein [Candidatus Eremiobacteraeota bacterium]MCW5867359.1 hypothetical protein [Candidatus Eremiobacteraeota bacterium]
MRQSKRRGATLVAGLLIVTVLVTLASAMVIIGSGNLAGSFQSVQTDQAVYAAEAGAWRAAKELSDNASWVPPTTNTTLPATQSQYLVQLFDPGEANPVGVTVPPGLKLVLATGAVPSGKTKQVGFMLKTGVGALNYAALTVNGITVDGGSAIDSRDPITDGVLTAPSSVAVNTPGQTISVTGGSSIAGSAFVGPGASTSLILADPGSITGTLGSLSGAIPLTGVTLPSDPSALPAGGATSGATVTYAPGAFGDVVVDGGATLNLDPGTYVFKSLTVTGGGKLAITAGVQIYIQNGLDVNVGSLLNPTKNPNNMKFMIAAGAVNINSGGTSYGVFYAPTSPVTLTGNGTIYGNLIGDSLEVSHGSHLHYDPNSTGAGVPGGGTTALVVSQQTF